MGPGLQLALFAVGLGLAVGWVWWRVACFVWTRFVRG